MDKHIEHLREANYAGYFEEMDKVGIPEKLQFQYNDLKKKFIHTGSTHETSGILEVFALHLLAEESQKLLADYQIITEKIRINRGVGTEEILKNKTVDDLDEKIVKMFFENDRVKFTLQQETENYSENYSDLSIHARLLQLSLAENGHLFKGTFLCLGKRNQVFTLLPSAAESKFIYFAGAKRTDEIRILEEVKGNIVQQYEKMLFVVERNIGRGRNRETNEDVPEIPLIALREFLANAYVHRAYLPDTQSFIQIEFYTDRLEINSPGRIPEQVDIENVRQSVLVNPTVALVFSLYQYIEKGGTGIAKAQSELARYGHPPAEIEQLAKPDAVRVRIWKKTAIPDSLEYAYGLLKENRIADFFEWAEKWGKNESLEALKNDFLAQKTDVFFKEKLKVWAREQKIK